MTFHCDCKYIEEIAPALLNMGQAIPAAPVFFGSPFKKEKSLEVADNFLLRPLATLFQVVFCHYLFYEASATQPTMTIL